MKQLLTILLAISLSTATAFGEDKEAARAAYADGHRFYALNQFDDALAAFKRAYVSYEDPAFLYNIAQCHRQLGHRQDAIMFYRSYLQNSVDASNAEDVRASIKTLEAEEARDKQRAQAMEQARRQHTETQPAAAGLALTSTPGPRVPVYKKWWLWTIVGVAAAGAATGIALAITSQRTEGAFMNVTVAR